MRESRQASIRRLASAVTELDGTRAAASEVLRCISLADVRAVLFPSPDMDVLAQGEGAAPGLASGPLLLSPQLEPPKSARGAILVSVLTGPDDLEDLTSATGVALIQGSASSHAAVVARSLGIPCIVGLGASLDLTRRALLSKNGRSASEGDELVLDGTTGLVGYASAGLPSPLAAAEEGMLRQLIVAAQMTSAVDIRVNTERPRIARSAIAKGAKSIGLCRSELLFHGPHSRVLGLALDAPIGSLGLTWSEPFVRLQLEPLSSLLELSQEGSVTFRLLDAAPEKAPHRSTPDDAARGARLAIRLPDLYELQADVASRAILRSRRPDAVASCRLLVPMVTTGREFRSIARRLRRRMGRTLGDSASAVKIGAMIESPRAALNAGEIAESADFLAIGTNDLSELTWGFSRDAQAVPGGSAHYLRLGFVNTDPWREVEDSSVGYLIRRVVAAGRDRPHGPLEVGVCGEHASHAAALRYLTEIGVDYVSVASDAIMPSWVTAAQVTLTRTGSPEDRGRGGADNGQ